jgi:hypothetical protein
MRKINIQLEFGWLIGVAFAYSPSTMLENGSLHIGLPFTMITITREEKEQL